MKRETIRFSIFVGGLMLLAGLLLASPLLINHFQRANAQPSFNTSSSHVNSTKEASISGQPNHIDIPSVNISVDIDPGYYNKSSQTWSLSLTKAQYATMTPEANNAGGNTFIYGHNRREVFNRLLNVKTGDQAIVTTSNGHRFVYTMHSRRDTKPTDSSLFEYQGPPILTLQTCSGFWYQNRSLFVFTLTEAV